MTWRRLNTTLTAFVALAVHRAFPSLLVHPTVRRDQAQEPVRL